MNANELADELEAFHVDPDGFPYMIGEAIAMLRQFGLAESIIKQQQLEIEALKKQFAIDQTSPYLNEWSNLVKKQTKQLTNEEILCLWDWWSGEILSTDILDFADTYKRVLLGEEGLLEWHKEYVKKMNEQYSSGKVTEK